MRACVGTMGNFGFTGGAKVTFFDHICYGLCHEGSLLVSKIGLRMLRNVVR